MRPVRSSSFDGYYGAPRGLEDKIGGLPFFRENNEYGSTTIYSVWEFTEAERKAIAAGEYNVLIGIVGEPIPPISVGLTTMKETAPTE